tara:strand:+ start:12495 stop:12764 length:270 start_codon:yes stop_codon:yes gene_type:complete
MTISQRIPEILDQSKNEAIIDQLRARQTEQEVLEFENWFNKNSKTPLHEVICGLLRNRSISRVLGSKWLSIILEDKEKKIKSLLNKSYK